MARECGIWPGVGPPAMRVAGDVRHPRVRPVDPNVARTAKDGARPCRQWLVGLQRNIHACGGRQAAL
eukprot:6340347-Lingulodinium_polyedra.AAC.1